MASGCSQAGPMVAMIFVRRLIGCTIDHARTEAGDVHR